MLLFGDLQDGAMVFSCCSFMSLIGIVAVWDGIVDMILRIIPFIRSFLLFLSFVLSASDEK